MELPSQITLENTELNLCLNGHRVTLKNRMFYPKGNTTLRICDCTQEPGKITGATRSAILFDKNSTTTLELWNGIFTGNEGESVGGAILLQGNGTFKMYGGKITGNAVISRLKTDEKGDVLLDKNGAQTYTSARGGGGVGVYGENTRFYLYGGEISGNKALSVTYLDKNGKQDEAGGDGGGIYAYKGSVYLYGGTVTDNYAQLHAGGVFTSYAYLEIDGGRISENTTDGGAGGFYAATGSAVLLRSGQISNNRAKGSGGGLVAQGNGTVFTYEGGKVSGNQSEGSAGGILVQSRAEMVMTGGSVTGNYSKGNGGGIYISTKSKLTMTGGSVTGNTAKSQGGGMYLNKATSTISGAYIGNNTAQENLAGGIRMAGGSLTISGAQIVGNRSKGSGCGMVVGSSTNTENGVKVNYYANCYVYNCTFRDNETEGSASGLLLQSKGTKVTVSGCRFYNNRAQSNGGGLYVSTNVEATVKACTFQGNQANRGGSLYASNCKVELKDLTVTENQGGVFITGVNCTATLTGIEVYGNTDKNGAGIRINSGAQVTMTDSRIYNNVTSGTAGGLYVASQSVVKLEKVEVFENQADSAGGFYAGAGATVVAEDLTIRGNSAAGMGGGLYNGANLTISNSKICDNTSGEQGGGVMTWKSSSRWTADDACTRLIGCEILNNRAKGQGGGVFVHRGGPALLRDTLISGNQAELEGGGICSDGKTELENVTVTENRSGKGWAVYLDEADYDGESYFAGYKSIAGNTVIENNQGGDLYLCKGTALAVVGSTLGEKARVDVTLAEGLLTQQVIGVYHYEGEAPRYVLTAGDRSITEPMAAAVEENAETEQPGKSMDIWLYALVGLFVPVIVAVLILFKKKTKKGKEV